MLLSVRFIHFCQVLPELLFFFLCSYIYGKDIPATPLSLFLFNVGKWQDTVWEERKRFLSPYIPFEEKFIGEVFGMGEVEVRYTGSFRV